MRQQKIKRAPDSATRVHIGPPAGTPKLHKIFARTEFRERRQPTLADAGYHGTGAGIHTPVKHPTDGNRLSPDNRAYNTLLRTMSFPPFTGHLG